MTRRIVRSLAVAVLAAGLTSAAIPAGAVPGPGTFTQVTTPGATTSFRFVPGATNQFTVSGKTTLDVTSVDIVCTSQIRGDAPRAFVFASGVPVTSGRFTATAVYGGIPGTVGPSCRLRAVPAGTDTTEPGTYLGSYSGPILHTDDLIVATDSGVPDGFTATAGDGDGGVAIRDAAQCGTAIMATVPTSTLTIGPFMPTCVASLPAQNTADDGSSVTVGGHNAYLPSAVQTYLISSLGLPVSQSALDVHMKIAGNGDVTISESGPLMRCSVSDTFPPTATSCPQLVSTGVTFERISTLFRDGHQVRVRDTFTSSDSLHHAVQLEYASSFGPPDTGELGFNFPGQGNSQFRGVRLGEVVTGLGSKAGTALVRSDLRASSDDGLADTEGLTWSQAPTKITLDNSTAGMFAMPYTLSVPASGRRFLGFAASEGALTADVKSLATSAVHDMVAAPIISSPHNGATVHGKTTKVAGKVVAGANGLPTKVTVNGHRARLGANSLVHGSWSVKFTESLGKHRLTVVATDRAGNTASRSITVHNKS